MSRCAFYSFFAFPESTTDSFVYGDIAKNWLQHGIYGLSGIGDISPTYIRLPGYPAFLAAVFAIFGMEHYRAVLLLQMFVDIGTCFLIADLARRLVSPRAARFAFLLAALCPFLANYVANALTETWEVFFTALALDFAIVGLNGPDRSSMRPWLGCGLAIGAAILLRPDGVLILFAVEAYLFAILVWRREKTQESVLASHLLRSGLTCGAGLARHAHPLDCCAICARFTSFSRSRRVMPTRKMLSCPSDSIAG